MAFWMYITNTLKVLNCSSIDSMVAWYLLNGTYRKNYSTTHALGGGRVVIRTCGWDQRRCASDALYWVCYSD